MGIYSNNKKLLSFVSKILIIIIFKDFQTEPEIQFSSDRMPKLE